MRMRPLLVLTVFAILAINLGNAQWNVFGSNEQIPTFQLRPAQNIRSIIHEIGSDHAASPRAHTGHRPPNDDIPPPWRHHIDFDEQHPGEDLIADETGPDEEVEVIRVVDHDDDQQRRSKVDDRAPLGTRQGHQRNWSPFQDVSAIDTSADNDDDSIISASPFFHSNVNMNDNLESIWSQIFGRKNVNFLQPWWKGENVCVKREEEEEANAIDEDEVLSESIGNGDTESVTENHHNRERPLFHMQFSSCEEKVMMHSCMTHLIGPNINKTIRTDYECCPGYLLNAKKQMCERGTLKSIKNTLVDVGAKEFSRLIRNVGLDTKLAGENLTLFVPTDDAIVSFMQSSRDIDTNEITIALNREETTRRRRNILMQYSPSAPQMDIYTSEQIHPINLQRPSQQQIPEPQPNFDDSDWKNNALSQHDRYSRTRSLQPASRRSDISYRDNSNNLQQLLLNHMVSGKLSTDDFVDEQVMYSEDKEKSVLRLNTWNVNGEKVNTINCARLVSVNHRCSNGMIHMINGIVKPVTKTIADVVTSEPELTTLKSFVSISGLLSSLRDTSAHFTLFAPTNAALHKLGPAMLTKLRNGDPCLKRIMRNHILPITLCTSIVTQKGTVRNLNHELMSMERTSDDKLFINGSQIITRDIVTKNGIVHIIDAVLTTELDTPVVSALEKAGFTSFLDKLEQVGLKHELDTLNNITIFAPTNQAMDSMPNEVLSNTTRLRDMLLYHIATPETRACDFTHDQILKTRLSNRSIRMNLYSTIFSLATASEVTAQCAVLKRVNSPACNGIIHTVDRILIPSDMNLLETLQTQSDFSIFMKLLQESELADTMRGGVPHTIFAPIDSAFYKLPKEKLSKILNDKEESLKILKLYIVKGHICCAGISPDIWFMTKSAAALNGLHIPIFRDSKGQVTFGTSKVSVCDLTASNGVVHSIDSLFDIDKLQSMSPHEYMQTCLSHDVLL